MELHFYYDVVCPYAYLASTQVEALAAETGADLVWHPVLLGGVFQKVGTAQDMSARLPAAKARLNRLDLFRQAERLGVPLSHHPRHPRRTVNAMRLLLAADAATRPALTHALYRAYWVDNDDVSDPETLAAIAREHGVDPDVVRDPAIKQALFDAVDEAASRGVFGVPTFFVGDEMWWGVDRLPLVREALGGSRRPAPSGPGTGSKLVFFHDFSSPFSYIASTQVERVAREAGADLVYAPFLLGALFKEIGTPLVPLEAMNATRRAYIERDMAHMAAWWGVPFHMTSYFPLRTVTALRVAIQEPATTAAIYRAAWVDDRNLSDNAVLQGVLDDAGFDGAALVAGTQDRDVKDVLRANTAWARRAGACGAPTLLVDDDLVFWGEDRLDMVADALRGWRPAVG